MPHYAIFPRDTAGAMLQHLGVFDNAEIALDDFERVIGEIDRDAFVAVEMSPEQADQVEEWNDSGAEADLAPEWLDDAIRRA